MRYVLRELQDAVADETAVYKEAMTTGIEATRPLSVARINQLCLLGDRMMRATARKNMALNRAKKRFAAIGLDLSL